MRLEQRIKKLEGNVFYAYFNPSADAELTEWIKSNPEYILFTQPENNNGIVMPEHLNLVLKVRIEKIFSGRHLQANLCNLLKIYQDLCNDLSSTKDSRLLL